MVSGNAHAVPSKEDDDLQERFEDHALVEDRSLRVDPVREHLPSRLPFPAGPGRGAATHRPRGYSGEKQPGLARRNASMRRWLLGMWYSRLASVQQADLMTAATARFDAPVLETGKRPPEE